MNLSHAIKAGGNETGRVEGGWSRLASILLEAHHFGTDGIDALAISAPKDKDRVLTTNVSLEMAQRIVQKNFTAAFKDLDRLRSFYQTTINESFPEGGKDEANEYLNGEFTTMQSSIEQLEAGGRNDHMNEAGDYSVFDDDVRISVFGHMETMAARLCVIATNAAARAAEIIGPNEEFARHIDLSNFMDGGSCVEPRLAAAGCIYRELEKAREQVSAIVTGGYYGLVDGGMLGPDQGHGRSYTDVMHMICARAIAALVGPKDLSILMLKEQGVYTTDPRTNPSARRVPTLSTNELLELCGSRGRSEFMNTDALDPGLLKLPLSITIGNPTTKDMTMITNDPSSGTDLYKIAVHENVWVLNMELPDLLISGKLHEIIGYIHDAGFNILTTPDSEGKISFVLSTENKTQHDCRGLTQRLKNRYLKSNGFASWAKQLNGAWGDEHETSPLGRIGGNGGNTMITIVNRDIPDEPGFLYGKILEPLKQANINVSAISHPTEPQAIAVVVDANDTQKATQILHDTLNPDPK